MKNITVIGAGTMGNGIAHVFAMNGYSVSLFDISENALQNGMATIRKNLDRMLKKERITQEGIDQTISNIEVFSDLEKAVQHADLVIEAASENAAVKLDLFKKIDGLSPEGAILASNTSSISITKIANATIRTDKVVGMHFFNPVPVMKLVEVIRGYNTSDATTQIIMDISKGLGKVPVEVNDYPGFVSNRILMPMINEAIHALHQGVGGVQEIDTVMKLGMAHPMGPLQLADFVGLDVCLNICKVLQEGLGDQKYAPCPLLVNMVQAGKLGRKSGEGFYDYSSAHKQLVVSSYFQK